MVGTNRTEGRLVEEVASASPEITAALIGLAGAVIGALIISIQNWLSGREAKRIRQLEAEVKRKTDRIEKLEREVHARIDYEDAAIEWVAQHEGKTGPAIKPKLRERARNIRGLKLSMSRGDLALDIPLPVRPISSPDAAPLE